MQRIARILSLGFAVIMAAAFAGTGQAAADGLLDDPIVIVDEVLDDTLVMVDDTAPADLVDSTVTDVVDDTSVQDVVSIPVEGTSLLNDTSLQDVDVVDLDQAEILDSTTAEVTDIVDVDNVLNGPTVTDVVGAEGSLSGTDTDVPLDDVDVLDLDNTLNDTVQIGEVANEVVDLEPADTLVGDGLVESTNVIDLGVTDTLNDLDVLNGGLLDVGEVTADPASGNDVDLFEGGLDIGNITVIEDGVLDAGILDGGVTPETVAEGTLGDVDLLNGFDGTEILDGVDPLDGIGGTEVLDSVNLLDGIGGGELLDNGDLLDTISGAGALDSVDPLGEVVVLPGDGLTLGNLGLDELISIGDGGETDAAGNGTTTTNTTNNTTTVTVNDNRQYVVRNTTVNYVVNRQVISRNSRSVVEHYAQDRVVRTGGGTASNTNELRYDTALKVGKSAPVVNALPSAGTGQFDAPVQNEAFPLAFIALVTAGAGLRRWTREQRSL